MNFAERLKEKWGLKSNWDFLLIMAVFSLAGMTVVTCRKPIFAWMGIGVRTPFALKTLIYISLVFPIYQVSLLVYGFLLGQFSFFWEKEKQLGRAIRRLFVRPPKERTASNKSEPPSPTRTATQEEASV